MFAKLLRTILLITALHNSISSCRARHVAWILLSNPKTQNPKVSLAFCRTGIFFPLNKIFKGIIFCVLWYLKLGNEVIIFKLLENWPRGDSATEKHLLFLGFGGESM